MAGLVTRKSGLTDLRALYEIATAAGRSCACHPRLAKSHETKDVDARAPRGMTKHQEGGMAALQQRTEIRDGMRIDWNVPITMDDGLVLRADIFRPVKDGKFPVILSCGPYAKNL